MDIQEKIGMELQINGATNHENSQNKVKTSNFLQKAIFIFTHITIEPLYFLYILPSTMSSIATQNLNLEKACRVNLKLNETLCDALAARNSSMYNVTDEVLVQKYVASMYAWKNVIQSIIPAFLLLFMGSWSDRNNRRKPCIVLPILGDAVSVLCLCACTYFFYETSMEYVILAEAIPPAITGGWFAMFMGAFSYMSSITSLETRTLRIGALSTFGNISHLIGISCSGILYLALGFYGVFGIALAMYTGGVIYGCIMIKEKPVEKKKVGFLRDFFSVSHVMDTFKVAFKSGNKNRKKRICMIMVLVMVIIGPMHGEFTVLYLSVRYRFQWNEIDYSIYLTFSAILHLIATIFSISFFSKYLKMDDALLGVISSISKVISGFIFAFAPNSTIFYLGAVIEMLNSTSFIAMRSIMSKLVPPDELGKINSLFGVSEALMPLVYGPIYSLLYKWTINKLPGGFHLFGGIFTLPAVFIFYWLYTEHKQDAKDAEIKEKQELILKVNSTEIGANGANKD